MGTEEARQSPGTKPGFFYGYIIVGVAFCIVMSVFGIRFVFGIFFTPMLTEFGWTRAMTSGAFSLSMVMEGLLAIVMGILTDRIGPRVVLVLSGFFLGIGYLLMSQIGTIWQIYLFYGVIIGIGMGGIMIPLMSTIARWFTARRGIMTGIAQSGTGIGTLIVPLVATQLILSYEWRMAYIILGSFLLVIIILVAQFLRRDPAQVGQVPYGESNNKAVLGTGTRGFSLSEAVCTRQFWLVSSMSFCYGFCEFSVMVHIAPHANELGISAAGAASILSVIGVLIIVGRVMMGGVADKLGNRTAFIIGFSLTSAALFWLVPAKELWMLYLFAVAFGFAEGGMGPLMAPLIARLYGLSSVGMILGIIANGFTIGGAVGPLAMGYIFDITGSYQLAFLVSAAAGIIGLILAVLLTPIRVERGQNRAYSTI